MTNVKQICVSIDPDDLAYCKTTRLSPSRILRSRIKELRTRNEDRIDYELANKRLVKKLEKVFGVLQENLSPQQFDKLVEKF